jgi:hypothetical protein
LDFEELISSKSLVLRGEITSGDRLLRLQCDFEAFQAAKQGRAVPLNDGEYMAARLSSAVATSLGCGCCHLCSSDTGGNRQQQEPVWDVESGRRIPRNMESNMACANIRSPKGKCLRKLAMMALAGGKEAAICSLLGDSSVGCKLKVCYGRMLRVTE